MEKFIQYLKDSRAELSHVSWPTQRQATTYTIVVIVVSIIVALFLGFADFLFTSGLQWLINPQ